MDLSVGPTIDSGLHSTPRPGTESSSSLAEQAQLGAKRVLDVVGAGLLLVALLPLLLVVGLLVKWSSPGPVLFCQERVGKNSKPFCMYKFRTLATASDASSHRAYVRSLITGGAVKSDGLYKLTHDPRVTPLGRVLRTFSLDELPQLVNILKGEMSLVGPRPALAYEVELYNQYERTRLSVTPGLTGLWQVSGRSTLTFQQMIELDLDYIEHWSIWLDVVILLRTPLVVLTALDTS